jgi:DNA-binding transcriptional LysR family regulator
MLSDFTKLNTFLTVIKEKSFSKASKKLGISQPAVTQQMKFIEDYLGVAVVQRRKNGIVLTKEGEKFYSIVLRLNKAINDAKDELHELTKKDVNSVISTSFVIGNYILPKCLNLMKEKVGNDVSVETSNSAEALEKLINNQSDIALIEEPSILRNDIIYQEWLEDEIVIFSNQELNPEINSEDLLSYKWVCREKDSFTRKLFKQSLEKANLPQCNEFNIITEVNSPTSLIQTVLHSSKDDVHTVSIVSKYAINDYIKNGVLFEGRLKNAKISRKLYIAYLKKKENNIFIEKIVDFLLSQKDKHDKL